MDGDVRPRDEIEQRVGMVETAVEPGHAIAGLLEATSERANAVASGQELVECCPANEPGRAGQRDDHSSARWLRWTSAARGA